MKPLNGYDKSGTPVSSNLVIWQGPDIECLSLCSGDTVSDVVFKLATEVCNLLTQLDVAEYNEDLQQFNLAICLPSDFQGLIKFILDRIRNLEECTGCAPDCNGNSEMNTTGSGDSCCDELLPLKDCLQYSFNGSTVTHATIVNYIDLLANYVCNLKTNQQTTFSTLSSHATSILQLEEAPEPVFEIPQITPSCVLPSIPTDIDVVLQALETQFCELVGATGQPNEILENIGKQPIGLESEGRLCGDGTLGSLSGWSNPVTNQAESIGNIWLTIQDMRCAIMNIQLNCCPTGCDDIAIDVFASLNGTDLIFSFSGVMSAGFLECSTNGTTFTITDSLGNSIIRHISIIDYLNSGTYTVNLTGTPINVSTDITITAVACFNNSNTNTTCEKWLSYVLVNTAPCPSVIWTPGQTTITYSFPTTGGQKNYSVEIWTNDFSTMLTNHVYATNAVQTLSGTFGGLTYNTSYKLRVTIVMPITGNTTQCPFSVVTTNSLLCSPPTAVTPTLSVN